MAWVSGKYTEGEVMLMSVHQAMKPSARLAPRVMTRGNLTLLNDGEISVLYNARSLAISGVDFPTTDPTEEEMSTLLDGLQPTRDFRSSTKLPVAKAALAPLVTGDSGQLSRLTLNIANSCNLWCSYCYADHGNYHSPTSLMPPETAVEVVKKCIRLYPNIGAIQFFGGEPLLNPAAMEAVCSYLTKECGDRCPDFTATTNGTILTEAIEDVLVRHNVFLTISLDGPSVIHDYLRPTRNGTSSHEMLMANLQRLKTLGVKYGFECTFTQGHIRADITVCDLLDYFANELGEVQPHIAWAHLPKPVKRLTIDPQGIFRADFETQTQEFLPPELTASLFRDAAKYSMDNVRRGKGGVLSMVARVLMTLGSRIPSSAYCPAFTSQMSIAADGEAYPCFMFIGDPRWKIGSVFEDSFPGTRADELWGQYRRAFDESVTGSQEWYAALTAGCVAGEFIATGKLTERIYEPVQQAVIEQAILGMAKCLDSN
jgi:uncharacterized protein